MKTELTWQGYYLATGDGVLRPIVAEGGTREESRFNWLEQFNRQFAEIQLSRAACEEVSDE